MSKTNEDSIYSYKESKTVPDDSLSGSSGVRWQEGEKMKNKATGLCFRCEHRAKFLEEGHAPRSECKDIEKANYICYSYKPVKPMMLKYPQLDGKYGEINDKRPPTGDIFGARMECVDVDDTLKLKIYEKNGIFTQFWDAEDIE